MSPVNKIQHRHVLAAPFVLILLLTLVGGVANSMDIRGRVVDDVTGEPVASAAISHGTRAVLSDERGEFVFRDLPRTSKLAVRPPSGYQLTSVLTVDAEEIRLNPLSITIYAHDETKTREDGPVPNPQVRDVENTKILGTGNASGQVIVAPHPLTDEGGNRSRVLLCGEGFEAKEIEPVGVLLVVPMKAGGTGCPPLPTPTPDPNATPAPSPTAETSPEPTPSPTGTP